MLQDARCLRDARVSQNILANKVLCNPMISQIWLAARGGDSTIQLIQISWYALLCSLFSRFVNGRSLWLKHNDCFRKVRIETEGRCRMVCGLVSGEYFRVHFVHGSGSIMPRFSSLENSEAPLAEGDSDLYVWTFNAYPTFVEIFSKATIVCCHVTFIQHLELSWLVV